MKIAKLILFALVFTSAAVLSAAEHSMTLKEDAGSIPVTGTTVSAANAGETIAVLSDDSIYIFTPAEGSKKTSFNDSSSWKKFNLPENFRTLGKRRPLLTDGENYYVFTAGSGLKISRSGKMHQFKAPAENILGGDLMGNFFYLVSPGKLYKLSLPDFAVVQEVESPIPAEVNELEIVSIFDELLIFDPVNGRLWGWRERPIDGTTERGWKRHRDLPFKSSCLSTLKTGQSHLALFGDKDRMFFHLPTESFLPIKLEGGDVFTRPESFSNLLIDLNTGIVKTIALAKTTRHLGWLDYSAIVFYFIVVAFIGAWFARKKSNSEEFMVGNRDVKWWAGAISMFATGASSISFMAIPASAFLSNYTWFFPVLLTIPLYFVSAYIIYPLLIKMRITSVYEYLERRFHPSLRYVASAQCILTEALGRMSVVLFLPAMAISAVTGMNVYASILLMGILTTVYTSFGGFEAVIWTDVFQGILMLAGPILMIVLAITGLPGGWGEFIDVSKSYNKFQLAIWDWDFSVPMIYLVVLGAFMTNLSFGNQAMVQRVFATPLKDVRKFTKMFIFCSIAISFIVITCGIAIFCYFRANPNMMDPNMSNDQIIPLYIVQRLPSGIAGLMIAALFAASMSTLSSSMNSVASLVLEDFYKKFRPAAADKEYLLVLKGVSLFVGIIGVAGALYMATKSIRSVFEIWNVLLSILGGGFAGVYILGMFTTRANTAGALCGIALSIISTVYMSNYTSIHFLLLTPLSVLFCIAGGYLCSLIIPGRKRDLRGLSAWAGPAEAAPAAEGTENN